MRRLGRIVLLTSLFFGCGNAASGPVVHSPAGDVADVAFDGVAYSHVGGVLITVQHRAPAIGLSATDATDIARTRAALGDLVLALTWTRSNAAAFGGDPRQLLLFGEGAGADLV